MNTNRKAATLQERLQSLFWRQMPCIAYRFSAALEALLADGIYLTAWPRIAAFVPALALLVGFLIGWRHPGDTFTFSLESMVVLIVAGCFGSALGLYAWLGYFVGDFLFAHPITDWMSRPEWLQEGLTIRLPMLFTYALLAWFIVFNPTSARMVCQKSTPAFLKKYLVLCAIYEALLVAVLQAGLTFAWVNSLPTLLRPLYTWSGGTPPTEAMQPLQEHGKVLVIAAAVGALVRARLEIAARKQLTAFRFWNTLQEALDAMPQPAVLRLPLWVAIALKSALTTMALSGMIGTWQDMLGVACMAAVLFVFRAAILPRLPVWPELMERIPLLFRLGVGIVLLCFLNSFIVTALWDTASAQSGAVSFRPLLYTSMLSLVIFSLFLPGQPARKLPAMKWR